MIVKIWKLLKSAHILIMRIIALSMNRMMMRDLILLWMKHKLQKIVNKMGKVINGSKKSKKYLYSTSQFKKIKQSTRFSRIFS